MADKEIDKDLTMIQPKPNVVDKSIDDLLKNAVRLGSAGNFSADPPSKSKVRQQAESDYYRNLADYNQTSSTREGVADQELDAGQSMFESPNDVRARNQGEGVKAMKSIGSGILQGGLVALEQLGYMADVEQHFKMFSDAEDYAGNWWSDLMKQAQEGVRESDTFKVYEEAPDDNSLASQIFKWSSLEGSLSSAVGYGLTGMGTAKLVSALGNTRNFTKLAQLTDSVMGNALGVGEAAMAGSTRAFVGPLATSAMAEYFQGQMMATDTYKKAMESMTTDIESGKMTEKEAQKLANDNAQDVVSLNMALMLTGHIKFGNIFKKEARLRGLVDNPSAMTEIRHMLKGAPVEGMEELTQELFQMEQEYDIDEARGIKSNFSSNAWDRVAQMALSNRALSAGAMGITGGPLQFGLIQAPFRSKINAEQREAYDNQQASLAWHKELVSNNFERFSEFDKATKQAILEGKVADADFFTDLSFLDKVAHSAEWGTLGILRKDLEDVRALDPEAAGAAGYDTNYSETADKVLSTIDRAEQYGRAYPNAFNKGEIVYTRLAYDTVTDRLETLQTQNEALKSSVDTRIKNDLGIDPATLKNYKFKVDKAEVKRTTQEILADDKAIKNQKIALEEFLATDFDYQEYVKSAEEEKKYRALKKDLYKKYQKITSPDYQQKGVKAESDNIKKLNEAVKQKSLQDKEDEVLKKESKFKSFESVKEEGKNIQETPEGRDKRIQQYREDTEGRALPSEESFSSIDSQGKHRVFSPGDIVRSHDGRMFKVKSQVNNTDKFGNKSGLGMPILYEVNSKGRNLSKERGTTYEEQMFILGDNDFLRPEVLQYKKGRYGILKDYEKKWASYVQPDSFLKPKDLKYQLGRHSMLAKGQAKSTNISAASLMSGNHAWTEEYAIDDLNKPFTGDYDVTLKMRDEGEGKKIIDVYRGDVLLTRLDKDFNMNYSAITDALAKGPVSGKVVEHYSSGKNIVKNLNSDGSRKYVSINEIKNMPKEFLPGGKIIIAQTKGPNADIAADIATSIDGEVFSDGYITTTVDDKEVSYEIPFHAMGAGDTYVLILSPSGRIVPLATTSKSIGDIDNGAKVDEIIQDMYAAINEAFKEELLDGDELDAKIWAPINNDNTLKDHERLNKFLREKAILLSEKRDDFKKHLEKTALTKIREVKKLNIYQTYDASNGDTRTVYSKTTKNVKLINPYLFVLGYRVSSTGNIVPSVEVPSPYNNASVQKTIHYNLEDHREEFIKTLATRRLKMSVDEMKSPIKEDGTNVVKELIESGNIQTDINVARPFMGSSATIALEGDDIISASQDILDSTNKSFRTKYGSEFDEVMAEVRLNSSEDALNEFSSTIETFLAPEESGINLINISEGSEEDVRGVLNNFISSLNIKQTKAALKVLEDTLKENMVDGRLDIFEETRTAVAEYGVSNNLDMMSRVVMALNDIKDKVDSGEFKLSPKLKRTSDLSPAYVQPEGFTFTKGSPVYHEVFGEAVVAGIKPDGAYLLKVGGKQSKVVVTPSSVFILNGKMHSIVKDKASLNKLEPEDPRRSILERSIARNEHDLEYRRKKRLGLSKDNEVVLTSPAMVDSIIDYIDGVSTIVGLNGKVVGGLSEEEKAVIRNSANTQKGEKFFSGLEALANISEALESNEDIIPEKVEEIYNNLKEVFIYSEAELETLRTVAEKASMSSIVAAIDTVGIYRQAMKDVLKDPLQPKSINIKSYNTKKDKIRDVRVDMLTILDLSLDGEPVRTKQGKAKSFIKDVVSPIIKIYKAELSMQTTALTSLAANTSSDTMPMPAAIMNTVVSEPQPTPVASVPKIVPTPKVPDTSNNPKVALIDVKVLSKLGADHLSMLEEASIFTQEEAFEDLNTELLSLFSIPGGDVLAHKYIEQFLKDNTPNFKLGEDATTTAEQFQRELESIKTMLPQVPVEIVQTVADMKVKFGVAAVGAFHKGVRYLVNNAVTGTAYHETFHAVADLYLTQQEKTAMAKERGYSKWDLALEEKLAEEFEQYAKTNKTKTRFEKTVSKVMEFFNNLLRWNNNTRSTDVVTKIFEKITSSGYASSSSAIELSSTKSGFSSIEEFKGSVSKENALLLQNLINSNQINIVC